MKKIIFLLISSALLVSCEGSEPNKKIAPVTVSNPQNSSNQQVFVSDWFPISLTYPEGWEVVEDTSLSMMYVVTPTDSSDSFQEMINIVVGGTRGKDLDAFFEGNIKNIQDFEDLTETIAPDYLLINGVKFKTVRYNYYIGGLPLTAQLYVAIKDNLSYIISASALQTTFDKYEEEFESVINSLTLHDY